MLSYDDRYLRFSFAIDQIAKNLQKIKNTHMSRFGLRSMHLMCLFQLDKNPEGLTGTELARCCSVDKAFISRVTGDLCSSQYVEYSDKTGTRYNNKYVLTEAGHKVMQEIRNIMEIAVNAVSAGVSEEQLRTFYQVLEQLDHGLSALAE